MATKEQHFLATAESSYKSGAAWGHNWESKAPGSMVSGILNFIVKYSYTNCFSALIHMLSYRLPLTDHCLITD